MQNEFEKRIQQEMETFFLAPQDEVWHRVELQIRKDKKRRRFMMVWMAATFLIMITGGYWLINNISNQIICGMLLIVLQEWLKYQIID